MPGPLFHPSAVAQTYRELNPGKFDEFDDKDLIDAIRDIDPETYTLIDPQLLGAEVLPHFDTGTRPPAKIPTYPLQHSLTDTAIETVLGGAPAIGGALLGSTVGPLGTAAGGASGAAAGAAASQYYQKHYGNREEYSPGTMVFDAGMGMLNPGARGATALARIGSQAVYGAAFGGGGTVGHSLIETGEMPSPGEFATGVGTGAVMGGAIHGGFEAAHAIAGKAPSFGDSTGALPTEGGPPPGPLDQLVTAQASAAQYQQEEAQIAARFKAIGGARPAASPDYHDALQLKGTLEELAKLNAPPDAPPVAIPPMRPDAAQLTSTPYAQPAPQKLLERGEFSDPNQTDLVGYQPPPPPMVDRLGGQLEAGLQAPPGPPRLMEPAAPSGVGGRTIGPVEVSSSRRDASPPPSSRTPRTAEERADLAADRRSRRLGNLPLGAGPPEGPGVSGGAPAYTTGDRTGTTVDRGGAGRTGNGYRDVPRKQSTVSYETSQQQPELLPPPLQPTSGPLEQTGQMGGRAATRTQPKLEGVERGESTERTYPSGLNAGPRRNPRQELHGQPRQLRRRVQTGKTFRFEKAPSTLPAEDPGTYPPEVRRELARMAEELSQFQHQPRYWEWAPEGENYNPDDYPAAGGKAKIHPAVGGAPVSNEILAAAEAQGHATRAEVMQAIRGAILEGKGTHLSDVAAQVARKRIAQEARDIRKGVHEILLPQGAGDHLIGWEDPAGNRALPDQDLSEHQRAARDATDGELLGIAQLGDTGHMSEEAEQFIEAARAEATKRGLPGFELRQPSLIQGGPGGDEGPALLDFEGGSPEKPASSADEDGWSLVGSPPPSGRAAKDLAYGGPERRSQIQGAPKGISERRHEELLQKLGGGTQAERDALAPPPPPAPTPLARNQIPGEFQPDLPGAEGVRATDLPTPEVADLPFALTAPPAKPGRKVIPNDPSLPLWDRLKGDEGVLILPRIPAGDRAGLKKWLKSQEEEHGGAAWFARVEHHLEEGNWDQAWKAAMSASVRSYSSALSNAKSPQEEALIQRAVKGTALQSDLNTQIVAGARKRAGVGTAPPVKDFPPSVRSTQAGAARGRATLGPAGVINPGRVQRPIQSVAPALRHNLLDKNVVKLILDATAAEEISTIPGNTDTFLRLYRQIGEQVYKGSNLKLLREAGVTVAPEELAQHFNNTVSEWGRGLQSLQQFARENKVTLEEAAQQMSMGGALRGLLKGEPPPRLVGAGGREVSPAGRVATMDALARDTTVYEQAMVANTLQKKAAVGPLRALHDASYAFMLSKWNTAVRNYSTFVGRYTVESLDHALTIPLARLTGDTETAALSTALLKERGVTPFKEGSAVTPRGAWSDQLQEIHNFTVDSLNQMKPGDVRRSVRLLLELPEAAAHYLGSMTGEDLSSGFANVPVLRTLTNPKVQRILTMFNRAQEFSARATVFDTTMRALLRARGLDPTDLLQRPIAEIAAAVGGRPALDDLLYTSTAQALEATFAGRTSKDSIPGTLIRWVNEAWPLKLGVPFPKFNFSSAPRFLFDHSPAALLDLIRFPLDAAGITAPEGTLAGGRLYRGTRAQTIQRKTLPNLALKIGQAERAQGTALAELLSTQREISIRNRQVARLTKRQQPGLQPGGETPLSEATAARDQLLRRRDTLKQTMQTERRVVGDLKSEQKKLLGVVADATGINAPNFSQFLARIATGTVGGLGAAWIIRSQPGAEGTRWYEYRVDREGKDPIILDFRPFAPFAQYLFVADVANDFYRHTNWEDYHRQVEETGGTVAGPLDRSKALWDNYEGKYTGQELGAQFAQAFLSISRAAGTTLTITDLMTQNGWPGMREASDAIVGTIGQFLSRFTVPGQMVEAIPGYTSAFPEEAKTRIPPRATSDEMLRPLSSPIANIPFAKELIPETLSQTTGKPIAAEYPFLRGILGIGSAPRDFVTEEVRRVGVPGQSVFIRETGDVGLDRMVAETYSRVLQEELPQILEDPSYAELGTPARQRDYLQRYIFPALKRAALAETRDALGDDRFQGATVRGETARYNARRQRMLDDLEAREPAAPVDPDGPPPGPPPVDAGAGPPPPGP